MKGLSTNSSKVVSLGSSSITSTSGAQIIHNEDRKHFVWVVPVRREFGDFRADELQVRLTDDHIDLIGLQQQWRRLNNDHSRRSFEMRSKLSFPLDERSVYVNETEDGSVRVEATGIGLLQQLLTTRNRSPIDSNKSDKKATIFTVRPYVPVVTSTTESLLRTLLGASQPSIPMQQHAANLPNQHYHHSMIDSKPSMETQSTSITTLLHQLQAQSHPIKVSNVPESKRVNIDDLLKSIPSQSFESLPPKSNAAISCSVTKLLQSSAISNSKFTPPIIDRLKSSINKESDSTVDQSKPHQSHCMIISK